MDRTTLERDLSFLLFKCTSVDGMSTEDPSNFPGAPGVITLIRNTGEKLKLWDHLLSEDPELKRLLQCAQGGSRFYSTPSLYRVLKLTFPTTLQLEVWYNLDPHRFSPKLCLRDFKLKRFY